jgi:hypothetical protein
VLGFSSATGSIISELNSINTTLDEILLDQVGEPSFLAAIAAIELALAGITTAVGAVETTLIGGFSALAVSQAAILAAILAGNSTATTNGTILSSIVTVLNNIYSNISTTNAIVGSINSGIIAVNNNIITGNNSLSLLVGSNNIISASLTDNTGTSVFKYTDLNFNTANRSVFKSFYNFPTSNRLGSVFQQPAMNVSGGDYSNLVDWPSTFSAVRGQTVGQLSNALSPASTVPPTRVWVRSTL